MSVTLIGGVKARTSLATYREQTDYMKRIFLLEPLKNPATLITMGLAHYSTDTNAYHWWNKETVPFTTQVSGSGCADTISTDLVVDDCTPFVAGDLVMNLSGANREVVLVTAITESGNHLTIIRQYGHAEGWTDTAESFDDDDYLVKVGNAYMQGNPIPDIVQTQEVDMVNYSQEFRSPFGMSEDVLNSVLRGEAEWPLEERAKMLEHNVMCESAWFWGKPYVGSKALFSGTHSASDAPSTMGGLDHYLIANGNSDILIDEDELTMFEYQDVIEKMFAVGAKEKIQYCPPRMRTALERWGIVKMNTFARDTVMGVPIQTWDSANGIVHFVTHDLLKAAASGLYQYNYFVDAQHVDLTTFGPSGMTRLRDPLGYAQLGGKTYKEQEIATYMGVRFGYVGTHGRLRFKTIGQ